SPPPLIIYVSIVIIGQASPLRSQPAASCPAPLGVPLMPSSESRELIAFIPLSQIQPRPITWLWPERLPLGKLAILDGDPGIGKPRVTLDLCARLTGRTPLPEGATGSD